MRSVLFVCTGNICRSPMAMTIFRDLLTKRGLADRFRVESAGTWAMEGQGASGGVHAAMQKRGLDASQHRARRVSYPLLSSSDLILTMERGQKEALKVEFPYLADRIYMLSEMVGMVIDVDDPIGKSDAEYEKTAQLLDDWLEQGLERILKLSRKTPHNKASAPPAKGWVESHHDS